MKKKILTVLCVSILSAAMTISGSAPVFAADEEKTEKETAEEKIIGEKEEDAFHVQLKNASGKDIKALKIKVSGKTEYKDLESLLEQDDVFAADEERVLYFLPHEEEKTDDTKEAKLPVYDVQLTFADDTIAEIHTFPFGDIEAGEIHMEGELAYLIFDSVSLKESVNTLETETKIAETIKAAEEAAQQRASQQSYDYDYEENYDYSYDYEDDYNYDYEGGDDSGDSGEGDGCLDNGLLN